MIPKPEKREESLKEKKEAGWDVLQKDEVLRDL